MKRTSAQVKRARRYLATALRNRRRASEAITTAIRRANAADYRYWLAKKQLRLALEEQRNH